ncbi:RES domain-containing protein [Vibrio cholerae]|uniref:RES domain-containing protein n=2 Tax=Vibrio cholerae TaxID=666 RepID=UPI0018F0CD09|nr:RES domain-containing protein [Vibrio cholerae]
MVHICKSCIQIDSVQREIEKFSVGEKVCDYCNATNIVAPRDSIFSFIETNFFESLVHIDDCSAQERASFWGGSDDSNVKGIWEIIHNLQLNNEKLESDLTEYLTQGVSIHDNLFILDDGTLEYNSYRDKWLNFINSISHGKRFFNIEVSHFLDDLFSVLHKDNHINETICTVLEPGVSLYRARIANTKLERESIISDPSRQLGAVPADLASDQRMTPSGISAFYASSDRDTCFSEVRAITGDLVISGEFTVNRPLKFLDLTKLEEISKNVYHPFEPNYRKNSHKSAFIKQLMFLLSKPASKRKNSSYLETQVIFEYLRVNFGEDISGLVFPSVQTGLNGLNVVLFPENSSVNFYMYINGQKIEFSESYYPDIGCYAYTKNATSEYQIKKQECDLSFVSGSLELHYIEAVKTVAKRQNIWVNHGEV